MSVRLVFPRDNLYRKNERHRIIATKLLTSIDLEMKTPMHVQSQFINYSRRHLGERIRYLVEKFARDVHRVGIN